jgi:hypothetical protein
VGGGESRPAVKADGWRWIITSFKADVYFSLSLSEVLSFFFFFFFFFWILS